MIYILPWYTAQIELYTIEAVSRLKIGVYSVYGGGGG